MMHIDAVIGDATLDGTLTKQWAEWVKEKIKQPGEVPPTTVAPKRPPLICHYCGSTGPPKPRRCGGCKKVRFCSRECQQRNWPEHKKYCSKG
ncbi:hypothetical protein TrRE_jg13204 [Triparma retinervis]|uniref:MYND-type domain-containing protein n=1 Tax=Triparma retinervis TaxID=2557542 RepID=A0A9W7A276_9STRA|nr:hypothetical protein TrRE_jg13204 [Triparma retinervis]